MLPQLNKRGTIFPLYGGTICITSYTFYKVLKGRE